MGKAVYIAEKPSVAQEFSRVLKIDGRKKDGYYESGDLIVTWCLGHLVTMSYPDAYDPSLKKWSLDSLPFLPETYRYEVIPAVSKQFQVVSDLLHRSDVETIYVCTDSGREGEYIYRLVEQQAKITGKKRLRVWIDSQTEEEILRGIRDAKDESAYDHISESAYCRAKEDYLMGINFSRLLTLKYGHTISSFLRQKRTVISVGRVMTCVQGMVVRREQEIRDFTEMPFYRVLAELGEKDHTFSGEWRVAAGSAWENASALYKDYGFQKKENASSLIQSLAHPEPVSGQIVAIEKKQERQNPPLLFNLAELQNACSKRFKISPDQTLQITQELYEKKLVTYPRTDARVLSKAVAKEIQQNVQGLRNDEKAKPFVEQLLPCLDKNQLLKSRYVDDTKITDHYAIIPTGDGLASLSSLSDLHQQVYDLIVKRFLSIFYPPAIYQKVDMTVKIKEESFFVSYKALQTEGYLAVVGSPGTFEKNNDKTKAFSLQDLLNLQKGMTLPVQDLSIKEGKTMPPKRYTSGSLILAMENAGQLIEDEDLRAQIRGSGIGTSATRGDIIQKLIRNHYLFLQQKSQVVTPTLLGEMIYDVVDHSIPSLLNPELTASWEKGLSYVAEGTVTEEEYMEKLTSYVKRYTEKVKQMNNQSQLMACYQAAASNYRKPAKKKNKATRQEKRKNE